MTPTGKPDDDHAVESPDPGQPAGAPPPPQWLSEGQPSATPLLPEDDPDEDQPTRRAQPSGAPENETSDAGSDPGSDDEPDESMHTVVIPGRSPAPAAGGGDESAGNDEPGQDAGQPPAPPVPPALPTSTDIPAPPPFPYAQEVPDATQVEAPAPPPFPYTPDIPDATRAEPMPQPPAMPAPPAPPAPPGPPAPMQPPQGPPAPEPFPYAQEIPGAPPARPAPEPFPYAQEIPGAQPPGPPPAEPFPYAQQMPGPPHPGQEAMRPAVPPPPAIEEPWRTQSAPRGPRRNLKKPLLIGVAVLAVAGLAAAGVLVVPGLLGGDDDKSAETGSKLAAAAFPVAGPARTDGLDQQFSGVASAGSTVVAVGSESGVSRSRSLFAVSTDGGRTFKAAAVRGRDGGSPASAAVPRAVAGSSAGWIAIGSGKTGGAVWTSSDGKEWTRQPDAVGRVFGPGNRVNQIVSTGRGFVAIGANSRKGDFSDAEAALWTSADGRQWETRIGDDIGLSVKKASYSLVEAVASGGVILLKGLIEPDNKKPPQYRQVWRSEDGGRTWAVSKVPVPKGSRGLAVGGGKAGFLAVREMKKGRAFYGQAFLSKDGEKWTEGGRLEMEEYNHTSRIVGDAQGYTALVSGGGDVLLSHSADGRTWKPAGTAPGKPGRGIAGAALAGGQTVLVGNEPGGGDMDPVLAVWDAAGRAVPVAPKKIPGLIRPDHRVQSVGASGSLAVAVGSTSGDAAVWTSADGASWKSAQGLGAAFTRPGPQRLLDVATGGAGWLAVGYDQAAPKRPLVVASRDGSTWQAADSAEPFRPGKAGALSTNAVAAGSAGYVIVGTEGPSAAAWFSSDLKNWERGSSADPAALKGSKDGGRWMLDAVGGGAGFTAVGGSADAKGNHPAVWSSPDGRDWKLQTLPLPGGVTEGHLTHVAAKDSAMVAAGIGSSPQGPRWIGYVSTDGGKSWRPASVAGDAQGVPTALAATPGGFEATAASGAGGSTDVVSLTSPDGAAWKSAKPDGEGLGGDGDQQITGLATFRNLVLGVGHSTGPDGAQPVLWTRSD